MRVSETAVRGRDRWTEKPLQGLGERSLGEHTSGWRRWVCRVVPPALTGAAKLGSMEME